MKVLIIGLSYKPDIDDIRESSSLKIWDLLEEAGCKVSYHDPFVPVYKGIISEELNKDILCKQDLIIIATNHTHIDYQKLVKYGVPILDTRRAYIGKKPANVYYL